MTLEAVSSSLIIHPTKMCVWWYYAVRRIWYIGVSPSGKARDFDSLIRWFESNYPSQEKSTASAVLFSVKCFAWRCPVGSEATMSWSVLRCEKVWVALRFTFCVCRKLHCKLHVFVRKHFTNSYENRKVMGSSRKRIGLFFREVLLCKATLCVV